MQNSLELQRKSLQACSNYKKMEKEIRQLRKVVERYGFKKNYSLGSLTAVMTNLNPFVSVPHPSVTYFKVTKLVRVNMAPTDCFVFRHVISD